MARRLTAALAVLLAALAMAVPALSLTVNEVAREVRCPTCNTPLDVSNSPASDRMKIFIADRIAKGDDKQEIIDALVVEFGRGVLATPPKSGFDLVAWIVPIVLVVGGLAAIPFVTRAWARRRSAESAPEITPEDAARLDEELRRRDA
ncbi:MAG: cytochrome c-type biogenesis protein CcmH [Actinobacteria bacterium]|nr:cytochrome c-type biogenesis protein CcmH [Actinomycetota bacterium]MBM3697048.1 cytochrome c-type biogenesis protein CcmH [Actinomycetota bacterium]